MVHYNFLRMRFYYNHLVKAHHYVSLQSWAAVDGKLGHHCCDTRSLYLQQCNPAKLYFSLI